MTESTDSQGWSQDAPGPIGNSRSIDMVALLKAHGIELVSGDDLRVEMSASVIRELREDELPRGGDVAPKFWFVNGVPLFPSSPDDWKDPENLKQRIVTTLAQLQAESQAGPRAGT